MNALTRRVSRLEGQLGLSAAGQERKEYWRTAVERVWEAQRRYLTKEELILEQRRMAILRESCGPHRTIAETLRHTRAILLKQAEIEAVQNEQSNPR